MSDYNQAYHTEIETNARRSAETIIQLLIKLFQPQSVADIGCGRGTWLAEWQRQGISQILGVDGGGQDVSRLLIPSRNFLEYDLNTPFNSARRYDLVTCAYALTELPDAEMLAAAERLWRHSDGVLAIIEPGRPRDYQRLMAVRRHLIELGGRVLAPCPHERECPLLEPDWCHFSVRLSRSRDHMRMKGGTLGYEDEKFSYLVVARPDLGEAAAGRVLRRPEENKFSVTLAVCGADGLEARTVPSRDKPAFKAAKKLDWGDAIAE